MKYYCGGLRMLNSTMAGSEGGLAGHRGSCRMCFCETASRRTWLCGHGPRRAWFCQSGPRRTLFCGSGSRRAWFEGQGLAGLF